VPILASLVVLHDPFFWAAVFSAIASVASAIFAWATWHTSRNGFRLAEQQDKRRHPTLVPYLADGFSRYIDGVRLLAFSVSLSNPSDIDNALSLLELQVDYRTEAGVSMAVKIPSAANIASRFGNAKLKSLVPPIRVGAHQTIAGWAMFELSSKIVGQSHIQTYTVLFSDAHGIVTRLEHSLLREMSSVGNESADKRI
jgi:hypothetical protein